MNHEDEIDHQERAAVATAAREETEAELAAEPADAPKTWRINQNVTLHRQPVRQGEAEHWETEIFGPHPCNVVLVRSTRGQWQASVDHYTDYGYTAFDALCAARDRAYDMLLWRSERISALSFEWVER